jgi:hypothetical protein
MRLSGSVCLLVLVASAGAAAGEKDEFLRHEWTASGSYHLKILGTKSGDEVDVFRLLADPFAPLRLEKLHVVDGAVASLSDVPAIYRVETRRRWADLTDDERKAASALVLERLDRLELPSQLRSEFVRTQLGTFECSAASLDALHLSVQLKLLEKKCTADSDDYQCKELGSLMPRIGAAIRDFKNTRIECLSIEALFKANTGTANELKQFAELKELDKSKLESELSQLAFNYQRTEIAGPGNTFYVAEPFGNSSVHSIPALPGSYAYIALTDYPHRLEADLAWKTRVLDSKAAITSIATLAGFAISLYSGGKTPLTVPARSDQEMVNGPAKSNAPSVDAKPTPVATENLGLGIMTLVPDGVGDKTAELPPPSDLKSGNKLLADLVKKLDPLVPRGTRFVGPIQVVKETQYELSILDKGSKPTQDGKFGAAMKQTVTYTATTGWFVTLTGGLQLDVVSNDVGVDFAWRLGGVPGGATKMYTLSAERQFGRYGAGVLGVFAGPRCWSGLGVQLGFVVNLGIPLAGPAPLPQLTGGFGVRLPVGLVISLEGGVRIFQRQLDRAEGTQVVLNAADAVPIVPTTLAAAGVGGLSVTFDLAVVGDAITKSLNELFTGGKKQ